MKTRPSETEVAASIIAYLENLQWEVFQEVTIAGGRADIVARQGSLIWIIETKTTFGLPVIEQARRWKTRAHMVSVGTPSWPGEFAKEVCGLFGIGILYASRQPQYADGSMSTELLRPKLNRHPGKLPKLCEEHKTYAPAGTNGGGYFTPFNKTCKDIRAVVLRHGEGMPLKKVIDMVDHHYCSSSTARSCMRKWIECDKVPGVEIRFEKGKAIVYPKQKEGPRGKEEQAQAARSTAG